MWEKFTSDNAGDFRQRYQGTFGFFRKDNAPPVLAKLTFVEHIVGFVDKRGQTYEVFPDRPGEIGFEFLPPRAGWTNAMEGAFYTERVAQRQFSRGVCERNTRIYQLVEKGFATQPINFNTLEKVYEIKADNLAAWNLFVAGAIPSYSISREFAMTKERVFVYSAECGTVKSLSATKVVVALEDDALFRTELSDAFRKIGVTLEVSA
jgi:hypothetical protein